MADIIIGPGFPPIYRLRMGHSLEASSPTNRVDFHNRRKRKHSYSALSSRDKSGKKEKKQRELVRIHVFFRSVTDNDLVSADPKNPLSCGGSSLFLRLLAVLFRGRG